MRWSPRRPHSMLWVATGVFIVGTLLACTQKPGLPAAMKAEDMTLSQLDPTVTSTIYQHVQPDMTLDAAEALERASEEGNSKPIPNERFDESGEEPPTGDTNTETGA